MLNRYSTARPYANKPALTPILYSVASLYFDPCQLRKVRAEGQLPPPCVQGQKLRIGG
jgi:hypothetical protein